MKQKYFEKPAELLYFDIMQIVNKYEDKEKASAKLRDKLGFNDDQINFIFDTEYDEKIEDCDKLREILSSKEKQDIQSERLKSDKRFIFLSMLSCFGVMFLFIISGLIILFKAIYDVEGRNEFNTNMMWYFVVPVLALCGIYGSSLEFKYIRMYSNLKKDISNRDISSKTLSQIIKIKFIKDFHYRNTSNIGFIIYNLENEKMVKYYLFARDTFIPKRCDLSKIQKMHIQIKYYTRSKYIISTLQRKEILKSIQ
jgi:hypothetical protein